ncbi:MAG: NUDIX domain-containing protein [Alphaproteobacteria bacterium]|nr:NUDIX domain-containing protein [Alphaproteobacteria bacterium]
MYESEMIEVLDDYGVPDGRIVSRDEAHEKGLLHRGGVVAIVNSENKILMQRRSASKRVFPGVWDISLAAHVSAGEDSITTVMREMNEEIGFQIERKIQAKDFRFLTSFREDIMPGDKVEKHWYDLFVIVKNIDIKNLCFNDAEVDGVAWLSYTDIIKLKESGQLSPRQGWITPVFKFINKL